MLHLSIYLLIITLIYLMILLYSEYFIKKFTFISLIFTQPYAMTKIYLLSSCYK